MKHPLCAAYFNLRLFSPLPHLTRIHTSEKLAHKVMHMQHMRIRIIFIAAK